MLNADEDAVIDSILRGMLDKELVKDEVKSELRLNGERKEPDPRMKMHMRHQQVIQHWKFFLGILAHLNKNNRNAIIY